MAAVIRSKVNGINPLVGVSRDDLRPGDVVTVESVATATTYSWSLAFKPLGSTATFSGSSVAQSPGTFTVDKEGPYLVRLVVDQALGTESQQFVRLRFLTILGDLKLVAGGEQLNSPVPVPVDISAQGWANDQNTNLLSLLGLVKSVVSSGRLYHVDQNLGTEGYADFDSVQDAIDAAASVATASLPWAVIVRPGTYVENLTFKANVHVVGLPGDGSPDSRMVLLRGTHTANANTGPISLSNLTLETTSATTSATLTKTGAGELTLHNTHVHQNGVSGTQGAAVSLSVGSINATHSTLSHIASGTDSRVAFEQTGSSTTATFKDCLLKGPSGLNLNPSLNTNTLTTLSDCRVVSVGGSGYGIASVASSLTLEYTRIDTASNNPLTINPGSAVFAGNMETVVRWCFLSGVLSFDTTGLSGTTTLSLGSSEFTSLNFPGGSPTNFNATTKATSLFYDNTLTGITAANVQDAIDEVYAYAAGVRTLDDAYDGGVPNSGSGRTIVADQGAVKIVDANLPAIPIPPGNTDGRLQVVSNVEIGSISEPEINLDPNPNDYGPNITLGHTIWALNASWGSTGIIAGHSTGDPLYRNYSLRLQTESTSGGSQLGRLIVKGGDGYSNGALTPNASSVFIEAGDGHDALAGAKGDLYLVPGYSLLGPTSGYMYLADPSLSTSASVTAAGVFVGGVTGTARFATNMGGFELDIDASDNLAAVLAKFNALPEVTATQLGGIITLTSTARGKNAEIFFLSASPFGLDAALGTFNGISQIDGTYGALVDFSVEGSKLFIGKTGVGGGIDIDIDTSYIHDASALIFEEAAGLPVSTDADEGAVFVSDGTGGLIQNDLYYRRASDGVFINLLTGSGLTIQDEGVPVGSATTLNFIGTQVTAASGGPSLVNVYIPPASYASHWDTNDGTTGDQSVVETTSRALARVASPAGGEGSPFRTSGWAGTNQDASLDTSVTFASPGLTTGFGGDSTVTVTVYDANGVTVLETLTTAVLTANGSYGSGNIDVTLTGYAGDSGRFKANLSVTVDIGTIFTTAFLDGGRYHVEITHTTDSTSDGSGPYVYVQPDVFLDTNVNTPSITGVSIVERPGFIVTKHLSGIEYYILTSEFNAAVADIDFLNRNAAKISSNLHLDGDEYGLADIDHSPFGTGSGNFSSWTNNHNNVNASYGLTGWSVTVSDYRYLGHTANISGYPQDPWAAGSTVVSSDALVLIDTYGSTSTDLFEDFDDEDYRQDATYNGGTATGNWVSTATLMAGEALVMASLLQVPAAATTHRTDGPDIANPDWSGYKPNLGGPNPDYSLLTAPVNYYRTFVDVTTLNRASFILTFAGTFVVDAATDLANSDIEIFIRRRASASGGNFGTGAPPLLLHGDFYNFATFDDGTSDGHIREASSSGSVVHATFGGRSCETGFFFHIRINNPAVILDAVDVTLF